MYIGRDLPNVEAGSTRLFGYDLSATLADGETISSVTAAMTLLSGTDKTLLNDPAARFNGNPSISGAVVTQGCVWVDLINPLVGNTYRLSIAASTTLGQVIIPWGRVLIQAGYGVPQLPTNMPPPAAQIVVLPAPGPKFTLPADGGYAGQDFPVADQGEARLYGFDISPTLSPGEVIQTASFSLLSELDQDGVPFDSVIANNPLAYFPGSAILSPGAAQQMIAWPVPIPPLVGNSYILSLAARTSFNQAIETWSRIGVES